MHVTTHSNVSNLNLLVFFCVVFFCISLCHAVETDVKPSGGGVLCDYLVAAGAGTSVSVNCAIIEIGKTRHDNVYPKGPH